MAQLTALASESVLSQTIIGDIYPTIRHDAWKQLIDSTLATVDNAPQALLSIPPPPTGSVLGGILTINAFLIEARCLNLSSAARDPTFQI